MLFAWLQIVIVMALAGYLLSVLVSLRRRNRQSWESLVARLQAGCAPAGRPFSMENLTADILFPPAAGLRALRIRARNARILLEMADYIERNVLPESIAAYPYWESLEDLRREAMQVRLATAPSLPLYAFTS